MAQDVARDSGKVIDHNSYTQPSLAGCLLSSVDSVLKAADDRPLWKASAELFFSQSRNAEQESTGVIKFWRPQACENVDAQLEKQGMGNRTGV